MLRDGYPASLLGLCVGAIKTVTKSFSNMASKSVAAPLTYLEGDDSRLMTGNMNKSSSLRTHAVLSTTYSTRANKILYKQKAVEHHDGIEVVR